MEPIILRCQIDDQEGYEATFLPHHGMNLASFKKGALEVIDQSTKEAFEKRSAGLGALIGPHFHRRKADVLPKIADESLFPHIAYTKSQGILDPFSHGIARYAPWKALKTGNVIVAECSGKDLWNGVPLSLLEGQNFQMSMRASLSVNGLSIDLSVVSDTDSLVGIHYYYRLPPGKNFVRSKIANTCYLEGELKPVPDAFGYDGSELVFPVNQSIDATFFPRPSPLRGDIWLETGQYRLKTEYRCKCEENSWQLFHKDQSSSICIEPLSAKDPHHPNLSVSSLAIHLQIESFQDAAIPR